MYLEGREGSEVLGLFTEGVACEAKLFKQRQDRKEVPEGVEMAATKIKHAKCLR